MTTTTELTPLLKRLKLGAVLNTLPERVALARREQLDYASFLQIILTDEINRRDHRRLELRLQRACSTSTILAGSATIIFAGLTSALRDDCGPRLSYSWAGRTP